MLRVISLFIFAVCLVRGGLVQSNESKSNPSPFNTKVFATERDAADPIYTYNPPFPFLTEIINQTDDAPSNEAKEGLDKKPGQAPDKKKPAPQYSDAA